MSGVDRRPSLLRQIGYAGLVACLAVAAGVLVWTFGARGVDAISEGRPRDAIINGAVCLVAVLVPILALAAYLRWLSRVARHDPGSGPRVPSLLEDILLGVGVLVVLALAPPAAVGSYEASRAALGDGRPGFAVGYGALAIVVVLFAVFCLTRYIRSWRN